MANKTMTNRENNNAKPAFITNSPWDKTMEERDEEKKQKEKKNIAKQQKNTCFLLYVVI